MYFIKIIDSGQEVAIEAKDYDRDVHDGTTVIAGVTAGNGSFMVITRGTVLVTNPDPEAAM